MLRFIRVLLLLYIGLMVALLLAKLVIVFAGIGGSTMARYILYGLATILAAVVVQALAQLAGVFLHTRRR